jgi:hypothetical protein
MCRCETNDICGETMHTEYTTRQQQQNTSNIQISKIELGLVCFYYFENNMVDVNCEHASQVSDSTILCF